MGIQGINYAGRMGSNSELGWGSAAFQRIGLLDKASEAASIYEQHVAEFGDDPAFYEQLIRPLQQQDLALQNKMTMLDLGRQVFNSADDDRRKHIKSFAKNFSFG